jgi:Cu-Zn family superoxide dismutase
MASLLRIVQRVGVARFGMSRDPSRATCDARSLNRFCKDSAMRQSTILRAASAALICASLSLSAVLVASAQDATPVATPGAPLEVPLIDAEGNAVGLATFTESEDGVTVTVLAEGLTPGEHGWHLHEVGICDPAGAEPFESAGGHWNPTDQEHGAPDAPSHHVGDFGNFTATADGLAEAEITTPDFTLGEGPTSVFDEDGTAIIIHAGMDDLTSQPSGDSGPRFACGVVAEPTLAATPVAAPQAAATPVG